MTADDVAGVTGEDVLASGLPLVLTNELHPLQERLLEAQIRKELAQAEMAELELAAKQDVERDRLFKTGRIRYLYINGLIGGQNQDAWMDALRHWGERDPGQPITIDINSPGGSVVDGLAMFDLIQRLRRAGSHVTTRALGAAFSMGAVILQAGDDRVVFPHSRILIHEGSQVFTGEMTRAQAQDTSDFVDSLLDDVLDIFAERAKLSKRQIANRWKRKDWFIDAAEAVKLGFADRIA